MLSNFGMQISKVPLRGAQDNINSDNTINSTQQLNSQQPLSSTVQLAPLSNIGGYFQRPQQTDKNKILELQQKHKEIRRMRREMQQQQILDQNKQDNYEIIQTLYKKKRLLQIYSQQDKLTTILIILSVALIVEALNYSSCYINTLQVTLLMAALLYLQRNVLMISARPHMALLSQDYKEDIYNIEYGLPLKEKKVSNTFEDHQSSSSLLQQNERTINNHVSGERTDQDNSPSQLGVSRKNTLNVFKINHTNSREISAPSIIGMKQQGISDNSNGLRKFKLDSKAFETLNTTTIVAEYLKYFNITHVLDLNGVLQILHIFIIAKYGVQLTSWGSGTDTIMPLNAILLSLVSSRIQVTEEARYFIHLSFICIHSDSPPNQSWKEFALYWGAVRCFVKFGVNLILSFISIMFVSRENNKSSEKYRKNLETVFKASRSERIMQNVRNGYGILNSQVIHYCNDQFCSTLGAKTKASAMHCLKQIVRKPRIHHQGQITGNIGNNSRLSQQLSDRNVLINRPVSVMEDILNFLKNRPSVETDEDIEYFLEKTETKSNQKFYRFFQFSFQLIRWDGQQNILLSVKEITQDKKMLEQRLLNQLRNMMFKSFTHEIKTPLNGVIQSMELTFSVLQSLKTRHTARPSTLPVNEYGQLHQLMKQIFSGVYILQNNLNDLIDYQQIESGGLNINFKTFKLRECYDHVLSIIKPQLSNKNVRFQTYFDPLLPEIMENDQDRVTRIITNLLLNAQKYTQKGFIKFQIKSLVNKKESGQANRTPQLIKFEVEDSGLGIPEDKLNTIFNLFENDLLTLNNINNQTQQKSAKVGLPICQHLCKKMGGVIKVNAVKDKGSKFWFILPIQGFKNLQTDIRPIGEVNGVITMENVQRGSPVTDSQKEGSANNRLFNEESYESKDISKDIEMEDIYESEEGLLGIPAGIALTSHMMNDNILISFFPNHHQAENQSNDPDEELKSAPYANQDQIWADGASGELNTGLKFIGDNRAKSQRQRKVTSDRTEIFPNARESGGSRLNLNKRMLGDKTIICTSQLGEVKEESKEMLMSQEYQYQTPINQDTQHNNMNQNNIIQNSSSGQFKNANNGPQNPGGMSSINPSLISPGFIIRNQNIKSFEGQAGIITHQEGNKTAQNQDQTKPTIFHKAKIDHLGQKSTRTKSNFSAIRQNIQDLNFKENFHSHFGVANCGSDLEPQNSPKFDVQSKKGAYPKDSAGKLMNENSWQLHTGQDNELLMNFTTACECSQILIVDDIDMNRYVLKQIFMSKYGIHCDEATNGKEAIQLIKARSFQECCSSYKIIIMDFEMPIMNGILATKKIRKYQDQGKIEKNIFIVAYTAYTDEESACKVAGMDFFLPKPASISAIQNVLREIDIKIGQIMQVNSFMPQQDDITPRNNPSQFQPIQQAGALVTFQQTDSM